MNHVDEGFFIPLYSQGYASPMDDAAIIVRNVSKKYHLYDTPQQRVKEALHPFRKKYHRDFWALQNVSFNVKKGEVVGVIGRNGSGKSTLLQILAGTLTPTSGEIIVKGRVSALLELGSGFHPELSGRENVFLNGAILGIDEEEMVNRFNEIVSFADIGDFIDQPVKTYSSGMYVRLAFAVAVCVEPEILIIDEALSVGDMAFQQKCLDRLRGLKEKGVTILLVTHDIMLTRNYCEYVVYLKHGQIVMVADSETAGEAYIKDMRSEVQKVESYSPKLKGKDSSIRYGSKEGEITLVEVINVSTGLPIFECGDRLHIRLRAMLNGYVKYPRFYVQIRDFRGYIIYGIYSMPDELEVVNKDNDFFEIDARLVIKVSLQHGEYGVTVSINNAHGEMSQIILDKQICAANFTVLPVVGKRAFNGVVDLNGVWEKPGDDKTV